MIRPIMLHGSSVLREVAGRVPPNHKGLEDLVADMFETMYSASGIGLAAPQLGLSFRLFVVSGRLSELPNLTNYEEVFINPRIEVLPGEQLSYEEGCLSIPEVRGEVFRPLRVLVFYENLQREQKKIQAEGLLARIIQHEYDHLQGVLFIDHFSSLRRRMIKKKLSRIGSGRYSYPVEFR